MTFRNCFAHFWILVTASLFVGAVAFASDEVARVVILVNGNDAESVEIGEYYASKRGIPEKNIIHLATSKAETITISEYVETIYNPLLSKLIEGNWVEGVRASGSDRYGRQGMSVAVHSISYLVTVRGVPLRISNAPELIEANTGKMNEEFKVNRGAVDGELALLLAPSHVSMTAFIPNPLFEKKSPLAGDLSRLIRVTRLDGPKAGDVMKLVDRTLEAERTGLMGRAYFDIGGPHNSGDEWMNAAGDLAKAAYFDTSFETTKRPMGMNDRYDGPAIYMGWYRPNAYGPWLAPRWSVPPGAIGFHLHSYSAPTVRSAKQGWLGPFVAQGYCATMGNVYEPYLQFTHRPQLLLEHLLTGHTFGEAITYCNPSLSWMGVAIGDPLYRPFKIDLEEQLAKVPEGPFAVYVHLREINRLKAEVSQSAALAYARKTFVAQPSLALAYELAQLFAAEGQKKESVEALKLIRYIDEYSDDEQILVKQIADFLYKQGEGAAAMEIYESLIGQRYLDKQLRIALLEGGAKVAATAGTSTQASRWNLEARELKASPSPKKK
ncbi:MAG: TIGR03790 family protein [Opitutales bacterium]|jgi:uncharacterized protein (TIGR03790 family)|nr:TIGR03790 family protein [Opitutales bacterium]MDP4643691.1 TIGR03790 family protein [Opitutales bacterium]MDP4777470.1 TIGR03790 family protein [Opitutales bacterium]MDP4884186.1 TIGR03790 family protein [Opitutales bacterium]MDP5079527.1 TIGR03790 family protein [Opitutales bacterium]